VLGCWGVGVAGVVGAGDGGALNSGLSIGFRIIPIV